MEEKQYERDTMEQIKKLFTPLDNSVISSQTSGRKGAARRLIVFILGGITYSEFRIASDVAKKYKTTEIFVGGSKILTPNMFIQDLKHLNMPHEDNTGSKESLTEREPLIGNGLDHSTQVIDDDNESLLATCERHLSQGGKFITDTFTSCASNICSRG